MTDQSLRDALEKLASEMEYDSSDGGRKIRDVLAAHPVEPPPVVTDEAVTKMALALADEVRTWPADSGLPYNSVVGVGGTFQLLARAALEAAYRVDVPRPMLDREAVLAEFRKWQVGFAIEGSVVVYRQEIADAVLALLNGSGVDSSLHTCPGCGVKVVGHERCGDPTRPGCAS